MSNPVLDALKEVSYTLRGERPEPGHVMARLEIVACASTHALSMPDIEVTFDGGRYRAVIEDAGLTWSGEADSQAGAVIALLADRCGLKAVVTMKDEGNPE